LAQVWFVASVSQIPLCVTSEVFPMRFSLAAVSLLSASSGVGAVAYDEARAIQYAELAGAAYCEGSVPSWSCGDRCLSGVTNVKTCRGAGTQAYVADWEDRCVVVFEGCHDFSSLVTDLEFWKSGANWSTCGDCKVHSGFLQEFRSLQTCIEETVGALQCGTSAKAARVTGHSSGAALAGLAAMSLDSKGYQIEELYTFGMPRTGDQIWAAHFNARFRDRSFRVTHHRDPVVQLPPDYLIVDWHFEHVEPEIFYDGLVSDGHVGCDVATDPICSAQYWDIAIDALRVDNHLTYMGVDTSVFGCPLSVQV